MLSTRCWSQVATVSAVDRKSFVYFVRSVAHRVRISSIVLFFSRDCEGGVGPVVDAVRPDGTVGWEVAALAGVAVDVEAGCAADVDAPPTVNDGKSGAEVAGCVAEAEAAGGAKDGNDGAADAELDGCVVAVEVEGKLNAGAVVVAAAPLDGVDWVAPPRLKPESGEAAGFAVESALDDTGGKLNIGGFCVEDSADFPMAGPGVPPFGGKLKSGFWLFWAAAGVALVLGANRLLAFGALVVVCVLVKENDGAVVVVAAGVASFFAWLSPGNRALL
jgi:hypothetical protein